MKTLNPRSKARTPAAASAPALIAGVGASAGGVDAFLELLCLVQDVIDQSLVILDSGLRVQSANRRFYEYFRLSPKQAQGRPFRELAGGQWNSAALNARLHDLLVDGTPLQNFELECRCRRLGRRLLRLGAARVPNEGRAARTLFLTISDITEIRRAETLRRGEERERIQREFLANVSHELRTPVTAIKGYAQTLKQGGLDDLKHRMSFVDTIERNADRLTRLIEDLMRVSKLERRPIPRLRKIALNALVKECVKRAAPLAGMSRIGVRVEIPPALTVSADRAQLVDVVSNLLDNAVKFNRPGGRVLIRGRAAGNEAVVVVQDTGVGISAKDVPRLFERFYRAKSTRARHGAGLGLSIARQIVAAHGGRIWAGSRKGEGASFHFTLPLWKAD